MWEYSIPLENSSTFRKMRKGEKMKKRFVKFLGENFIPRIKLNIDLNNSFLDNFSIDFHDFINFLKIGNFLKDHQNLCKGKF